MGRNPASPDNAYATALRLLSRREHSRPQLATKLAARGINKTTIAALLDRLVDEGWLSDARYAAELLRARQQQGYGPARISAELRAQSIPKALIANTLAAAETDWFANARNARTKRFGTPPPEGTTARSQQINFLLRRGFATEHCRFAIEASDNAATR